MVFSTLKVESPFVTSSIELLERSVVRKKMFFGASHLIFQRAKCLRNNVTVSEMGLWGMLKQHFPEHRFRRQHPISNYIVDFYCHKLRLVIELDGGIHNDEEVRKRDEEKESTLKSLGLQVIRFTNEDIKLRIEKSLARINDHIIGSNRSPLQQ